MNVAARLPATRRQTACPASNARPMCRCSAFAAAPQFSIAASGILLGLSRAPVDRGRRRQPRAHRSAARCSGRSRPTPARRSSRRSSRSIRAISFATASSSLLFAIVPIAYRLFRGERSLTVVDVVITVGALNAVYGIVQYGILNFDNVARRVQGNLGHYMTYSGVIMLVACIAVARVMFRRRERIWAALVLPALLVALVADAQPQRLGRRLRRHRHALPAAGFPLGVPPGGAAAGRARAVHRVRAGGDHRPLLLDAVAQGRLRRQRDQHLDAAVEPRPARDDQDRACASSRTIR